MLISLELPDELVVALDKLIVKRPDPPVWPFEKLHMKFSRLSLKQQKQLEEYQQKLAEYQRYPSIVKPARGSRSAVAEELLRKVLEVIPGEKPKKLRKKRSLSAAPAAPAPQAEAPKPSVEPVV